MIQKSCLVILILVLCTALIQGMPTTSRGRCLCRTKGMMLSSVPIQRVAEVEFHRPSSSCDQEELVVTFKRNERKRCLNINLEQGRRIKEAIMKKRK
ncbi:C-X-C motif chemokine 11 [Podarcis lilfordi]|uniref:C-X-C motif chemokine 11 n=1 Tax=Podarcis lilfordi TaxID=74358 RepID=A0AA35KV10_9SAUR|nr:C-X-C motif chemokine 11 [Podarcis lilfordi]